MQTEVVEGLLEVRDVRLQVMYPKKLSLDIVESKLELFRVREDQGPQSGQVDVKCCASNLDDVFVQLHPDVATVILPLVYTPGR